jgi:hypothetical protein
MAEVMKGLPGAAESLFGIDDPLFSPEFPKKARELRWGDPALQFALLPGLLQGLQKLTPDDLGERPDGEQVAVSGRDPSVAV